ncbi:radial spoke head 10 homolog B isoform X2 [Hyperolius riggenbachi]|uniref:radial spoke head 10 homolog B isoform X2 n=1 Tax=Hyperolius riggenbachi TaxID=752182 RepID=UPI0035A2B6D0
MGKIKKKDGKKADKLTLDASEDSSSKFSSVSVSPNEDISPPFLKVMSEDEPTMLEEPPAVVPVSPEAYNEPVLSQLIVEKYEGELVHGLYEGEGIAYYKDGNVYRGLFSEGLMHGKGTYTWTDGLVYEGQFDMNFPMGHGIYKWPDGSRYEGQVYRAIRHGTGIYISSDQQVSYVGEWCMGKRHGKGTMYYNAEETSWYEGEWIHNNKEGWGVQRFPSENIYEGQWKNNKFHGVGRMRWLTSNEEYMGQWESGVQNGPGTHTWFLKRVPGSQYSLRNEYVGNFVNGERHGHGQYFYANGAMYDGEWKNNKKHGMGKFVFKNGRIYIGEFANDQIAEYPNFKYDRVNTPDLSGIRTQSPGGGGTLNTCLTTSGIPSLAGSYIELDIKSLLNLYPENERAEELKQVEYGILRNLTMLRRTYKFYSSLGNEKCFDNAFLMTKLQFWRFLKDCRFHHYNLTLSEMDRKLADHGDPEEVHSPYATMLLRTFLTNLIYLAHHITTTENLEKKISLVDCLSKILEQNISPHASAVKGFLFCEGQKTEYAMSYIDKCWDIYKACCHQNRCPPHEPTMTMRDFIWMMNDLKIINEELTVTRIVDVLAEDDPCVRDGNEIKLELELTFLEFFEALFGCAVIYVTDELLSKSMDEASQGEDCEECEADEVPRESAATQVDHPHLRKADYVLEGQDLISALRTNEKRGSLLSLQPINKLQNKALTEKWFQQINVFFTKIFFPAYEHIDQLKDEIPKNRMRKAEEAQLEQIREEEAARLKALKAEEEAKRIEQMELEKASELMEDMQISKDQTDDNRGGHEPAKEEPAIPPSTASTKISPAASKRKKK